MMAKEAYRLPSVYEVRRRIQMARDSDIRYALMALYLFAARVSEIVAYASPSDETVGRGPTGEDVYITLYNYNDREIEVAVFTLRTAKRGGMERKIALPMDDEYEPWTEPLYNYFTTFGSSPVFPFTRQYLWSQAKDLFKGLYYPIERYKISKPDKGIVKVVDKHYRQFTLHALRHIRTTELVEYYGFDGIDLSAYGGWTMKTTLGVSAAIERYAHLNWQKYFPKLLKKRRRPDSIL